MLPLMSGILYGSLDAQCRFTINSLCVFWEERIITYQTEQVGRRVIEVRTGGGGGGGAGPGGVIDVEARWL
jgi:hypothetical protein